jgi:RNA polymerase sigma-70 factor (ECF subfamily)
METVERLIVEELTDRQRRAIIAVVFAGMPTEEVARRMGTNRNALYKLMHDARQRLKRRMEAEDISLEDALAAFDTPPGKRSSTQHV